MRRRDLPETIPNTRNTEDGAFGEAAFAHKNDLFGEHQTSTYDNGKGLTAVVKSVLQLREKRAGTHGTGKSVGVQASAAHCRWIVATGNHTVTVFVDVEKATKSHC